MRSNNYDEIVTYLIYIGNLPVVFNFYGEISVDQYNWYNYNLKQYEFNTYCIVE